MFNLFDKKYFILYTILLYIVLSPNLFIIKIVYKITQIISKESKKKVIFNINHLGLILNGHHKWAMKKGKTILEAYSKSLEKLFDLLLVSIEEKIETLTVLFTSERCIEKKSNHEINKIYEKLIDFLEEKMEWFMKQKVRLYFVGDLERGFNDSLKARISNIIKLTEKNDVLFFNILIGYDGKKDILNGFKNAINFLNKNNLNAEDITEKIFCNSISTAKIPNLDLIINTGYIENLESFLPYQSMNAEISFVKDSWPSVPMKLIKNIIYHFILKSKDIGL